MSPNRFTFFVALVLTLPVSLCGQAVWGRVSSTRIDWNGQNNVEVIFEVQSPSTSPGGFTRIRIQIPGQKEFKLTNPDGWVKYNSTDASRPPKALSAQTQVRTEYLLALPVAENRTALFLFGSEYGSSPGTLDVLELSPGEQPQRVLHRPQFGLTDVRDLDADGVAEVIGYPCLSQEFGNGLLTYDPFNVYKLPQRSNAGAVLSVPLSKGYNLKHYYGWAGVQCSEQFAVVLHPPNGGKPRVMKTQEAEKQTSAK
jgi:hypothetical protein